MAKQIKFEHDNREYTLEFTRESIKQMEREGFLIEDIVKKPMLTLPKLFSGAFKAHHRYDVKQKQIDELFSLFENKQALIGALVEMFNEPLEALMDNDEKEGNAIAWEQTF